MVNSRLAPAVEGPPLEFVYVGVTVMVAVTGAVPALTGVNTGKDPVPEAAKPIAGLLFVHAYVVVPPVLRVAKLIAVLAIAFTNVVLAGCAMVGTGLTVIVKLVAVVPTQDWPAALGLVAMAAMVVEIGLVPLLLTANAAMFPAP